MSMICENICLMNEPAVMHAATTEVWLARFAIDVIELPSSGLKLDELLC